MQVEKGIVSSRNKDRIITRYSVNCLIKVQHSSCATLNLKFLFH